MEKTMGRQVRSGDWVKTLVLTAVVAAMACAATLAVQIPSPTGGYLNLGDAVVLLGAYLLGPGLGRGGRRRRSGAGGPHDLSHLCPRDLAHQGGDGVCGGHAVQPAADPGLGRAGVRHRGRDPHGGGLLAL